MAEWIEQHDGLDAWIVVLVEDGRASYYLWDSVELVADGEWDCTGRTELHPLPDTVYDWEGDGLEMFETLEQAEAEAARINGLSEDDRSTVGPAGIVEVAFFGRWDDDTPDDA